MSYLLDAAHVAAFDAEIHANVLQLFNLGVEHYEFANSLHRARWRQIISRAYYGAYNITKSIRLLNDGGFTTDSSDHKKCGELPVGFNSASTYSNKIKQLRDDRNLSDYDHLAEELDLAFSVAEYLQTVSALIEDGKNFMLSKGLIIA